MFTTKDTMYLAGTRTGGDWLRNIAIPTGLTSLLPRYSAAEGRLRLGHQHRVVGHSMGGAVALELQHRIPGLDVVTYGAPVASWEPSTQRFRDTLDPISSLDRGAIDLGVGIPHSAGRSEQFDPRPAKDLVFVRGRDTQLSMSRKEAVQQAILAKFKSSRN